jgi:hypothetical protein
VTLQESRRLEHRLRALGLRCPPGTLPPLLPPAVERSGHLRHAAVAADDVIIHPLGTVIRRNVGQVLGVR